VSRYIGRLGKGAVSADVHRFRTNGRRVETLISELTPESRNRKKLLKLLRKLRKKAGKLRDLDVQIAFLENLKIPDRQNHRAQLLDALVAERGRRSRKLPKSFDEKLIRELRKRLRRARAAVKLESLNPLRLAFERLPDPSGVELGEKALHAFRIEAKRARYLAEIADTSHANEFVQQLKHAQDVIGEWHDVLKLKQEAFSRFGSVSESTLVAALDNIARARFRRARAALAETLANLAERGGPVPLKTVGRSEPVAEPIAQHASVA
jgi:CHAD domain-containing protein